MIITLESRSTLTREKTWMSFMGFSRCQLSCVFALLSAAFGFAHADDAPVSCTDQKSSFDRFESLQYAMVKKSPGNRVYIHPEQPSKCPAPDAGDCAGKAYVVVGDRVALGKSCGSWTYIRYKGEKSATFGWVDSDSLSPEPAFEVDDRAFQMDDRPYVFELTRGRGTAVCDAFLNRLNHSYYQYPPYCGIPESDSVPGFARLNRKMLSVKQAQLLFSPVYWFEGTGARSQGTPGKNQDINLFAMGYRVLGHYSAPVWRYQPPIDIENNGHPDDVVIWQGIGKTTGYFCGQRFNVGDYWRVPQRAFVMTDDGIHVDEEKTRQIFYRPPYTARYPNGTTSTYLVPIGLTADVFEFMNLFYVAAFYDSHEGSHGDFEGNRKWQIDSKTTFASGLGNTLAVFLRKDGKTTPICEYDMRSAKGTTQ